MKIINTIKLSLVAIGTLGEIAIAGGNFSPVTPYEISDELKEVSPWYVGGGLVADFAVASDHREYTHGFMAKAGYDFSESLGVEVRGSKTNWDYEDGKLKHLGAFIKPMYGLNEETTLYGLVGYAKTSMQGLRPFSKTGLAYGVGVDYALNEDFGLFFDYERLLHDGGVYDLDALSFGVSYGF